MLDEASWNEDLVFDHITIRAEGGGKRATVCLFPANEVFPDAVLDSPDASCADAHRTPWYAPPTIDTWGLPSIYTWGGPTSSRTINFVFEDGDQVNIEAAGGFGGARAPVATGHAEGTADRHYPTVFLELKPGRPAIPPDCRVALEPVHVDSDPLTGFCNRNNAVDCPQNEALESRSTEAMFCAGNASRVLNGPNLTCSGGGSGSQVVWHSNPMPASKYSCMLIEVTGHFARCAPGNPKDPKGCEPALTTDCRPPVTAFRIESNKMPVDYVEFSCMPPYRVPVTFSVKLNSPQAADSTLGIAQDPLQAADPESCFFDLYSLKTIGEPCDPE